MKKQIDELKITNLGGQNAEIRVCRRMDDSVFVNFAKPSAYGGLSLDIPELQYILEVAKKMESKR